MNWYGYADYLKNNNKNDTKTVNAYLCDLQKYERFLDSINCETENAAAKTCADFLVSVEENGFSPSTCARILVSLRAFYTYLLDKKIVKSNPAKNIKPPKTQKKLPYIMSVAEVDRLLGEPKEIDYRGIRDKAMLEIMYGTGIRVSELIALNADNVDFETGSLTCTSSDKYRVIPVGSFALNALALYFDRARPYMIAEDNEKALFVNMYGKRMSRQGFWKIIKGYVEKCGIRENITPHTLRHSFALHLIERGANLKAVAQMLGHSDISSTRLYLKNTGSETSTIYHQLHPRA